MNRPKLALAVSLLVVVAIVVVTVAVVKHRSSTPTASATAVTTATVVQTDVVQKAALYGTIGFVGAHTIVTPAGVTPVVIVHDEQAVAAAEATATADTRDAADTAAVDDQTVANARQVVATAPYAALAAARGQLALAQKVRTQHANQAQAKAATDAQALADARATLAADQTVAASYGATSRFTALAAVGQVVNFGEALWAVDGQTVPLLHGALTPWRAFVPGMAPGPDVAALNAALAAPGADTASSNAFTDATATAIARLQSSLGVTPTGTLLVGSMLFEPTPVRVTAVRAPIGGTVTGASPVLDVTSTTPVANLAVPVDQAHLVQAGQKVTVTLPDGTTTDGTVTTVGTVATPPSTPGGSTTIAVTVALATGPTTGALDHAPVTVRVTNQSATGVLAVPSTALLAVTGGGDALEVITGDGTHQLVGVTTGIFDDQSGLVQVSGTDLAAGQKVVVAA